MEITSLGNNLNRSMVSNGSWLLLTLLALIVSFGLSWLILAPLNFAFEWLYGLADIDQHIETFGPKNTFRQGFELTTDAERFRLFSAIVSAIHSQGAGLEALVYHNPQGTALATLLTRDEVIHLQDVAILIDKMTVLLVVSALMFFILLAWLYFKSSSMPSFRSMLTTALVFIGLVVLGVLVIGPHKVFYTLHVWVFPEEHKWFFYYEESLMSTLMKAPDLFAYIAILLLVLAVPIFTLIMWLVQRTFSTKINRGAPA